MKVRLLSSYAAAEAKETDEACEHFIKKES